jgi:hypothetical protein
VPECRFLGSETRVAVLRDNLRENLHLWYALLHRRFIEDRDGDVCVCVCSLCVVYRDEGEAFHVNLGRVLGCALPGKEAAATEDRTSIGCGICYALRFKGDIPTVLCSLATCNKAFHEARTSSSSSRLHDQ